MTIHDMVTELPNLTLDERLTLLDALTQSLRTALTAPATGASTTVVDTLHGAWHRTGTELTDEMVDQLRYEALMEKYS